MGIIQILIIFFGVLIAVFVGYKLQSFGEDAPVPVLPRDVWWGTGERRAEDDTVRQFKIQVSDQVRCLFILFFKCLAPTHLMVLRSYLDTYKILLVQGSEPGRNFLKTLETAGSLCCFDPPR